VSSSGPTTARCGCGCERARVLLCGGEGTRTRHAATHH
jgi:hypothetical protein